MIIDNQSPAIKRVKQKNAHNRHANHKNKLHPDFPIQYQILINTINLFEFNQYFQNRKNKKQYFNKYDKYNKRIKDGRFHIYFIDKIFNTSHPTKPKTHLNKSQQNQQTPQQTPQKNNSIHP